METINSIKNHIRKLSINENPTRSNLGLSLNFDNMLTEKGRIDTQTNSSSPDSTPDEDLLAFTNATVNSPCSIHSLLDPKLNKSRFRKASINRSHETEELARTSVAVRGVSKSLAKRRIKWKEPKTVLVITKPGDKKLVELAKQLVTWLLSDIKVGTGTGMTVYVDKHLEKSKRFEYKALAGTIKPDSKVQIKLWTPEIIAQHPDLFDFVITLGGDGTVLYTSWLFQKIVPAVIPFNLGSLGFLTTFDFSQHRTLVQHCLDEGVRINMRMRFSCTIYKYCSDSVPMSRVTSNQTSSRKNKHYKNHGSLIFSESIQDCSEDEFDAFEPSRAGTCVTNHFKSRGFIKGDTFEILNDLVVDRGPSPFMSQLELYGDGEYLTTVQADGLTVATPTGSTAYSLAAGGSLVHPEIPALLISPICPHSLSFRPMLLPDSTILYICVPFKARGTAWASFDGRGRVELKRGDLIRVEASKYPFPTVCASGSQSKDWFRSLNQCLLWNQRTMQKAIEDTDDSNSDSSTDSYSKSPS